MHINTKNKMIIRKIIKEQLKYQNISQKELAITTGLSPQLISNFLSGKKNEISLKTLVFFENAFRLPQLSLVSAYINEVELKELKSDSGIVEIAKYLEQTHKFKLYSETSIYKEVGNILRTTSIKRKEEELNYMTVGYKKFKNKPLAYLWISLLEEKYSKLKSKGLFKKSSGKTVMKGVLDILIDESDSFDHKEKYLKIFLSKHGIILANEPFIKNSSIRGITYKKSDQRYIFMSDMNKREAYYIFTLIHELLHLYSSLKTESSIDKKTAIIIRTYLKKYNKEFQDITFLMDEFEKKYDESFWNTMRQKLKRKINFGNPEDLIANFGNIIL